jgi:hypothetical protein
MKVISGGFEVYKGGVGPGGGVKVVLISTRTGNSADLKSGDINRNPSVAGNSI